jgi:methylenetetrahydrofolate dehydrogenase (NADP+)/methenyltetrahydrofolate cyclohydrolase
MIKDGVIIFDAGTSEDGGELKGDADPACAVKASLVTPVPGGIGPLTVACLLKNVVAKSAST